MGSAVRREIAVVPSPEAPTIPLHIAMVELMSGSRKGAHTMHTIAKTNTLESHVGTRPSGLPKLRSAASKAPCALPQTTKFQAMPCQSPQSRKETRKPIAPQSI